MYFQPSAGDGIFQTWFLRKLDQGEFPEVVIFIISRKWNTILYFLLLENSLHISGWGCSIIHGFDIFNQFYIPVYTNVLSSFHGAVVFADCINAIRIERGSFSSAGCSSFPLFTRPHMRECRLLFMVIAGGKGRVTTNWEISFPLCW